MNRRDTRRPSKKVAKGLDLTSAKVFTESLPKNPTLSMLEEFQEKHDEAFHRDVMSWPIEKQVEHCQMHLAKLNGLLATICGKKHHGEATDELEFVEDRIADLLVFTLKLANLYRIDLGDVYRKRLTQVERKKLA